jgi:hypothetical protein
MLDATAVMLLRCAQAGRSYWAWTDEEWAGLLGRDQDGFRQTAPAWADDAVIRSASRPSLRTACVSEWRISHASARRWTCSPGSMTNSAADMHVSP